jgi:hypothetical protein
LLHRGQTGLSLLCADPSLVIELVLSE